jgi:hypothetical protein
MKPEKQYIVITADRFWPMILNEPEGDRSVAIHLDIPNNPLGLAPGTGLALRFSPHEARLFAEALQRKADEAEAGLHRA